MRIPLQKKFVVLVSVILMITSISSISFTHSDRTNASVSSTSVNDSEVDYVIVTIPDFDVKVNGELIDTEHSQYPVISYKSITYFPMTSDYLAGIGLNLKFDSVEGLKINVKKDISALEQSFLGAENVLGSQQKAQIAAFPIEVNGKSVNNNLEEYPVLLYKNITYFPMTWKYAVEEFQWDTKWSDSDGLSIDAIDLVKESDIELRTVRSATIDDVRMDDVNFTFENDENILGEWHCVDILDNPLDFRPYEKSYFGELMYELLTFSRDGSVFEEFTNGFQKLNKWTKGLVLDAKNGYGTASRYFIVEAFGEEYLFVEFKNGDFQLREEEAGYYVFLRGDKYNIYSIGNYEIELREVESTIIDGVKTDNIKFGFELDEEVIGKWQCVDFIDNPYMFKSNEKNFLGRLHYKTLEFASKGSVTHTYNNDFERTEKWTNGILLSAEPLQESASRYFIVTILDKDYMFYEFKNGDYTYRNADPSYYVFERVVD